MKILDLVKLEKKEIEFRSSSMGYDSHTFPLKDNFDGYNSAISELGSLELEIDEAKLMRIIRSRISKKLVIVDGKHIFKIRGYEKAAKSITTALPSILKVRKV